MSYATVDQLQSGMLETLTDDQRVVAEVLLERAGRLIDAYNANADADIKADVSCNMVQRAIGSSGDYGVPMGATQGAMSGLSYSQSWTISSGGSVGELYLSKTDKRALGVGNAIGSYSPVMELVRSEE